MSTGTCKCFRLCWEIDSMLVSNQCCNSVIYEIIGLKGERNIQQRYLVNQRICQSKHFGANFGQIGQGISEIHVLTFEILEQSDFWWPF